MRPRLTVVMLLPSLALVGVLTAPSASATGVTWQKRWQASIGQPLDTVEQPYPTYNYTGCAWGDQDQIEDRGTGTLGAETTDTQCTIADLDDSTHGNFPKNFAAWVGGAKPDFSAWITDESGHRWDLPAPAWDSGARLYVIRGCIADPVADAANSPYPLSSYWPQVPGSIGYGLQVNYTLHIAPTTSNAVRSLVAEFEVHGSAYTPYDPGWSPRYLTDVPCPPNDGL
jgi:hypothetical protein